MTNNNLSDIRAENIYLTRNWNIQDWRNFREWCNYYDVRIGMNMEEWSFRKHQLLEIYGASN